MARVRQRLQAKFQRELIISKRRNELADLDALQRDRIIAEHRDQQKMLRLVIA